ncbi:MAG TPA: hypothetical protein VEX18_17800 [Polyangiaceae bacterium]|nr:hypothetical protein [Polyangiaceae bacterium]
MVSVSVVGMLLGIAGRAAAQEGVGANVTPGSPVSIFGSRGQVAISSEAGATLTHTTVSGSDDSSTNFVLRPGVDYFLIDRLSLGAFVGIDYESLTGISTTRFGVGPRVGYSLGFSNHFSLWPRVGVSYNSSTIKTDAIAGFAPESEVSNNAVALNLFAPLLFHTNHYFAGVGPALDVDLSGDAKATTFAIRVTLGGWIF